MKILLLLIFLLSTSVALGANKKSQELAEAAWNYYYFGESEKAEMALKKAIEVDPDNEELQEAYAKSLFKNGKYTETINFIIGKKQESEYSQEHSYLLALSHFNNYETDAAKTYFKKVKDGGGSLSAAAERYLQKIENVKRFDASAAFGLVYDTSIIDEDLISTSDGSDGRLFMSGSFGYKLKKMGSSKVKLTSLVANYYSFDDNLSIADPLFVSLGAVIERGVKWRQSNHQLKFLPAVELLWLDAQNTGSRDLFLISPVVRLFTQKKGNESSSRTYYGELRYNLGQIEALENTATDVDGLVIQAGLKQTEMISQARYGITDLYTKFNVAQGSNIQFYRLGGSYSYLMPFMNWNVGLTGEGKLSHYPRAEDSGAGRTDLEGTVAAVGTRSVKELLNSEASALQGDWLFLELKTGYSLTFSSQEERDDSRFIVSSLVKGLWQF